jgi:hypothetical protein
MSTAVKDSDGITYRTAGWIRSNLGVPQTTLLKLVVAGRVRGLMPDCGQPIYSINDVKKWQAATAALATAGIRDAIDKNLSERRQRRPEQD